MSHVTHVYCTNCQQDYHYNCSSLCQCRCTVEAMVEHTSQDNLFVNTENTRYATPITEYEVRQRNRQMALYFAERRRAEREYEKLNYRPVAPRGYRWRKALSRWYTGYNAVQWASKWHQTRFRG